MSETPKFDLSRIKVGNAIGKFKRNEIALPKNNFSDTAKVDEAASQKTETPDTVKLDEAASQKTETPDTVKLNEVASQKTETPDTVKLNEVASQKTQTSNTVKLNEVASQKTQTPEIVKLNEVANQKTTLSSGEQKNINESAKEIQALLAALQTTYPTHSDYEKQVFVNKFREEIRKNLHVQEILVAGGTELIKIICQPLNIPIEMGKKWLETAKHYR
ncbi:MAG: hypothetical protein WA959_32380 [Rivularia sp. (in: cyanobacteria)]